MKPDSPPAMILLRCVLLPCAVFLAALVLWFAWLRETPVFWRNEGGHPVWLRELVLEAFFPVFALHVLLLVLVTVSFLKHPPRSSALCCVESAITALLWAMMAATIVLVLLNNVANLLDGRPLHSHPEETTTLRAPVFYRLESL